MENEIHAVADEVLRAQADFDPLMATMLGVPDHDHQLADPAKAAQQELRSRALLLAERAAALVPSALIADDRLTAKVAEQQALAVADRIDAALADHSITDFNYVGPAAVLLSLMSVTPLHTFERAEAYLARLRSIPGYLRAMAERHRAGAAAGRIPVRRLVEAAVAHLDRYLAEPAVDPLLRPSPPPSMPEFAGRRERIAEQEVRPAFARYRQMLAEEMLAHGRPDDRPGLAWLPHGEADYLALARVHTTTGHTPDHLHQTGLDILDALRGEYAEIGKRLFGTTDQAEIFARLKTDPAMRWNDGDELLASARDAITRAEAATPQWFGVLPRQRCEVQPVPAGEAPGAPFAYYFQPPLDGARPGVYYANTYQAHERDRFLSEVTAFHEAVPGHHLQLALAIERTDLPPLRRLCDVNAAIEGWALYSERLADEMGLYSSDVARLGMLAMDSMRAGRLVADTGLHAKGWSRRQAIEFFQRSAPLSDLDIASEVDRYIANPAQALSYMVGRLEIQRMRQTGEQRLGARFDVRAFHDLILCAAPLPLDVLDQMVTEWLDGFR